MPTVTFDIFAIVGLVLLSVPITCYFAIMRAHFMTLKNSTLRVQTLITRTALFLPAYPILLWLSLRFPALFGVLEGPISIIEGLSFYGFFGMIVANLGGPDKCVKAMIEQAKKPCCCCPADPLKFYNSVRLGLFQFLTVRPILVTIGAIFAYNNQPALAQVFNGIGTVQFVWGFGSIIMFYENVYRVNPNVNGACKLFLLKTSVGGIVLQGLVLDILYTSGTLGIKGNDEYSGQERSERALCMAILLEYSLFSLLVLWAYGSDVDPHETSLRKSMSHINPEDRPDIEWPEWRRRVFALMDVFHDLAPSASLVTNDSLGGNSSGVYDREDVRNPVGNSDL